MAMSRLRVLLGEYNIHTLMDGKHVEERVSRIYRYPNWNSKTNVRKSNLLAVGSHELQIE